MEHQPHRPGGVVTKPVPNLAQLDPGRPEITALIDAMLRAREVVAARSWSISQKPTRGGEVCLQTLAPDDATRAEWAL
jgi:hypothetical protein